MTAIPMSTPAMKCEAAENAECADLMQAHI